ncbi:hypothetical protein I4U23_020325 [Adineta vaga]|nr:hypothetical protein I4U23_020325 [Adineta vaga]
MNNQTNTNHTFFHYFNLYINVFYLIFGNISNFLKILFFLQKPLRSLPCTSYILFATITDFMTLNNLPLHQLLIHLYPQYHWIKVSVDWSNYRNETNLLSYTVSNYDIIICKIRSYLHLFSTDLSFQMLLFASINRFYSTYRRKQQSNTTLRFNQYFCNQSNVYRLCLISSIIFALLSIQHLFNFTIQSPSEGCVPSNRILWSIWISSFHCFIIPLLMILFGLLTLKNICYKELILRYICCSHCQRRRWTGYIHPQNTRCQNSISTRVERQLTFMIISEIFVTIFTVIPYGIYAFFYLFHGLQNRTMNESNGTKWMALVIQVTMYVEPSCGFYIYLLTLSTLRKRFKKIIMEKITSFISSCYRS